MRQKFGYISFIITLSVVIPVITTEHLRAKRQAGYVYDRPNVAFDLPSQPTVSTQAPTVDRTLAQQMYYAYPVPSGGSGNTVTTGQSAGTTSVSSGSTGATVSAGSTGGASVGSGGATSNVSGGYNYGTSSSGTQTANTGLQNVASGFQSSGSISSGSGYDYNTPSPNMSPSLQRVEVSTSAPKYLPPTAGASSGGGSVNIGGASVAGSGQLSTGSFTQTSSGSGSLTAPSDQYLPPLGTSGQGNAGYSKSGATRFTGVPSEQYLPPLGTKLVSSSPSISASSGQSNSGAVSIGGSISAPSAGYLSPNPVPSPIFPTPEIPGSSGPVLPTQNYLPPGSGPGTASGSISTPASTYLPPVF